jgi:hypothetical protein
METIELCGYFKLRMQSERYRRCYWQSGSTDDVTGSVGCVVARDHLRRSQIMWCGASQSAVLPSVNDSGNN